MPGFGFWVREAQQGEASQALTAVALGAALGLVAVLAFAFAIGQGVLLFGGQLGPGVGVAGLGAALAGALLVAWRASLGWIAPALTAGIVVAAVAASALIYDLSFDGQWYHFEAVNALAHGWNPIWRPDTISDGARITTPWAHHYPLGAYVSAAMQLAAGLPAEATKSHGLIVNAALLLAAGGAGLRFGLTRLGAGALAVLAALNPISLTQLFTRMPDGTMGVCLALTAIFAAVWIHRPAWWAALGAALSLTLALNLKFTAVPLGVVLCGMIVVAAWRARGWDAARRLGGVLLATGGVAIMVLGAHPYVTNTLRAGHPFHPAMGPEKWDLTVENWPPSFVGLSPIQRLARSYFGPTASGFEPEPRPFKIPLTVSRDEIWNAGESGVRLGGFGPLFSGALLIGLGVAVVAASSGGRPPAVMWLLSAAGGVLVLTLMIPDGWWARYTPYAWWGVLLLGLAGLASRSGPARIGGGVVCALLLANSALVVASSANLVAKGNLAIRAQNSAFAQEEGRVCVQTGRMFARRALLEDQGIDVRFVDILPLGCAAQPLAGTVPHAGGRACTC